MNVPFILETFFGIAPRCEAVQLILWQNLIKWVNFDICGKVVNSRTSKPNLFKFLPR